MKKTHIDLTRGSLVLSLVLLTLFSITSFAQNSGTIPSQFSQISYPENGEDLIMAPLGQLSGRHQVVIQNNSGYDAIVKIEDYFSEETYRLVFIRKGYNFTITGIRDGSFMIKFALGSDYSPSQRMFLKSASFTKFDTPRRFDTTVRYEGNRVITSSSKLSVTLAPVVGGNAQTSKISAKEF